MKALIVYSSKYDFTRENVLKVADSMPYQVEVVDINKQEPGNLDIFDVVLIGGSIYMGQINKKIKSFCDENLDVLQSKKIGLFISCGLPDNAQTHFENAFSGNLLEKASVKVNFGGELRMDRMKFGDKMITKMMQKAAEKEGNQMPESNPEAIQELIEALK